MKRKVDDLLPAFVLLSQRELDNALPSNLAEPAATSSSAARPLLNISFQARSSTSALKSVHTHGRHSQDLCFKN